MPSPSTRSLLTGCVLAALVISGPARAADALAGSAPQPTASDLKSSIDKATYIADKARSTADKARIAGYVADGFGLLSTLGVGLLLLRRGQAPVAVHGAALQGPATSPLAELGRLFADRRQRRLLRRQQDLARTMADISATFTLYQDQAKEVDAVMLSIREKLTRLDADIASS